jgi:hypothetical protein
MMSAELAGEVNRMNTDTACEGAEPERFVKARMQHISCSAQPDGAVQARITVFLAEQARGDFEHHSFDRKRTCESSQTVFPIKSHCEPGQLGTANADGFARYGGIIAHVLEPAIRNLRDQKMKSGSARTVGVNLAARAKKQAMLPQAHGLTAQNLLALSVDDEADAGAVMRVGGHHQTRLMATREDPKIRENLSAQDLAVMPPRIECGWFHGASRAHVGSVDGRCVDTSTVLGLE